MGMDTLRGNRFRLVAGWSCMLMFKVATFYIAAFVAFFFASFSAVAATCTDLEASLTVIGNQLYAAQHANVVYCLSIYPSGYACGSDIQFHIESQVSNGSEQRRNGYRYVGPPSTGSVVSVWYTEWESCGSDCPIDDLSTDPNDPNGLEALIKQYDKTEEERLLTIKLENKFDAYSLLSPETRNAEQCLADRVASELLLENSGYKVTATVRTLAYQAHLRKLWDKFFDLKTAIDDDPNISQMCPALIAKVEGEMGFRLDQDPTDPDSECTAAGRNHCIRSIPAGPNKDPKHAVKLAFDISQTAVKNYQNILLPPRTMATEANACKLTWGGGFTPIDRVHFLCCVK